MNVGGIRVVKWEAGWTRGEFLAAVMAAGGLEPGALVDLEYRHAEACPKPAGGVCRCDPEVTATVHPAGAA